MKIFDWFKRHLGLSSCLLFAFLFAAVALWVFEPVLPLHLVTVSPDAPHSYSAAYAAEQWRDMLAGKGSIFPDRIHQLLVNPFAWQELEYALPCFMAALAICFYLRTRGVCRIAAYAAGSFFAFSGYSFTLVNAGHRGWFVLIAYMLFSLGLLVRCFSAGKVFHFAMLGAVIMWGGMEQPDIWMLFMLLFAFYVLWLTFRTRVQNGSWRFVRTVYPRFLISAAVMLGIGYSSLHHTATSTVAGREQQLKEHASATGADAVKDGNSRERNKWIFATNWSMPPEDVAEMLVPGIFGDESYRPRYPLAPEQNLYWGRLGRPYQFVKGRMMPNYRQHTLYAGLLVVMFALTAVLSFRRRRSREDAAEKDRCDYGDLPFWSWAALAALLLAFGRYTPFYRLVWYIPGFDLIRAPVKFYHIFELAVCILAGFGVNALWRRNDAVRKMFFGIAVSMLGAICLGCLVAELSSSSVATYVAELGFGKALGERASSYMRDNLLRSLGMAAFAGFCAFALWRKEKGGGLSRLLLPVLIAVAVLDLAVVDRRYIVPIDVSPDYRAYLLGLARGAESGLPQQPVRWENVLSMVCGCIVLLWGTVHMLRRCNSGDKNA